jgi:O-antigen/teichoic acid export membrane protein
MEVKRLAYLSNMSWLFAERVLRLVTMFMVNIYVIRYLGPEGLGLLGYAQSFVGLFMPLAAVGLDGIVVRELVKAEKPPSVLLGTAFALKLMGAGLAFLLIQLGLWVSQAGNIEQLVTIIAIGTFFKSFGTIDLYFQSKVLSRYVVYAHVAELTVVSVVKIGLIWAQAELIWFAWVVVVDAAVLALGLLVVYWWRGKRPEDWRFDCAVARSLLGESWAVLLGAIAITIQSKIDQVMLGKMVGAMEVGQYFAAMRIIEILSFLPMIMKSTFAPVVTKAKQAGTEVYEHSLMQLYRVMTLLFLSVSLPLFLFSEQLIVLLFGDAFRYAGTLLSLLTMRLLFIYFTPTRRLFIINESLFRYVAIVAWLGAMINIALNAWLIPIYQSHGAIFASIISLTLTVFIADAVFSRTRHNLRIMLYAMATCYKVAAPKRILHLFKEFGKK